LAETLRAKISHDFDCVGVYSIEPIFRAFEHYVGNASIGDQAGRTSQYSGLKTVHVDLKEIDLLDVQLVCHLVQCFGAHHGGVWRLMGILIAV
jgi:hypothetical protein